MTNPVTTTANGAQPGGEHPLNRRVAAAQAEAVKAQAKASIQLDRERLWAEEQRKDKEARDDRREKARQRRAVQRKAQGRWVQAHTTDLLFVPVIAVPAALSWSSMASYGASIYGPAGYLLPALSEGAMWAFAGATTMRQRENDRRAAARAAAARRTFVPAGDGVLDAGDWDEGETGPPAEVPGGDKPLWHLRIGTVIFAAYAAVLNFLHGMTAASSPHTHAVTSHTYVVAVSMALVSVAGVVAHQLVTAGPRSSKQERDAARMDREVARRELAVRRRAVRAAKADLDESGHALLVYEPGTVSLGRSRLGRMRLVRDEVRLDSLLPAADPQDEPQRNPHPHALPAPPDAGPLPHPAPDGHPEYALPGPEGADQEVPLRVPDADAGDPEIVPGNVPPVPDSVPDDRDQDDEDAADTGRMTPAEYFEAVVSQVMALMSTAEAEGRRFRPGYDVMTDETGKSLSWCEKAVGEARKRLRSGAASPESGGARREEDPQP